MKVSVERMQGCDQDPAPVELCRKGVQVPEGGDTMVIMPNKAHLSGSLPSGGGDKVIPTNVIQDGENIVEGAWRATLDWLVQEASLRSSCVDRTLSRQVWIWGESLLGGGEGWCEGPWIEKSLKQLRRSKEASVAGAEWTRAAGPLGRGRGPQAWDR